MNMYTIFDRVADRVLPVVHLAENDESMLRKLLTLPEGMDGEHFVLCCNGTLADNGTMVPVFVKICKLSQVSEELEKKMSLKGDVI